MFVSQLMSTTLSDALGAVAVCGILYVTSVAIYRLWLSPIAHFPGPKLAGLTFWYEFYYDWILTGTYYKRVAEMHEKYGPIVRVSPDELHIDDASYYDKLYVTAAVRKSNLYHRFGEGTGFEDLASPVDHDMHRAGNKPLKAFFSRAGLSRVEYRVTERLDRLCEKLQSRVNTNDIVNLTHAFNSYVNDIISSILFHEPSDYLSDPTFNAEWYNKLKQGMINVPLFAHLPWLARTTTTPILKFILEVTTGWNLFDDKARRQLLTSRLRPADAANNRSNSTVLTDLVEKDTGRKPYGSVQCSEVAQLFQQAAGHNLNRTLEGTITFLCLNEEKQKILTDALQPLFTKQDHPPWVELEKVPYLSACINEGIRLSAGNMRRAPRVSPDHDLQYKEWIIPKGTPVGMTIYWMLMDPAVFPNPTSFEPERWLNASPEELKLMQTYFVPFTKGSRVCLGNHLTSIVLHHTIGSLFRPGVPKINLYETDETDVLPLHGLFFTLPRIDSPGARAFLTEDTNGRAQFTG